LSLIISQLTGYHAVSGQDDDQQTILFFLLDYFIPLGIVGRTQLIAYMEVPFGKNDQPILVDGTEYGLAVSVTLLSMASIGFSYS
jgi:hypothetical protein